MRIFAADLQAFAQDSAASWRGAAESDLLYFAARVRCSRSIGLFCLVHGQKRATERVGRRSPKRSRVQARYFRGFEDSEPVFRPGACNWRIGVHIDCAGRPLGHRLIHAWTPPVCQALICDGQKVKIAGMHPDFNARRKPAVLHQLLTSMLDRADCAVAVAGG